MAKRFDSTPRNGTTPGGDRPPLGTSAGDTQDTLREIAAELRQLDTRLAEIAGTLPLGGATFNAPGELRGAVDCVRVDLIADAIESLETVGNASEAELNKRFEERQRWLTAGRA